MFEELLDSLFRQTRSPAQRRRTGGRIDKLQAAADAAGVVDQSGVTDLANAAVSAVRALRSKDPRERKEHWKDAGIRAVSAIPIVGDLAKLGRMGKYADTFRGARAESQAARTTLRESRAGIDAAGGRRAQGLTPSELMTMGGRSRDQIQLADKEKRAREESQIKQEEASAATAELVGSLKKLTGGVVGAAVVMVTWPKIVQKWTEALVESRRHLSRFDGRMAGAYARLDIDRTFRDMRTAQATGGTSSQVANSLSELEESTRPLREMGATLTNIAALIAASGAKEVAEILTVILRPIATLARAAEKYIGVNDRPVSPILHSAVQSAIDSGFAPDLWDNLPPPGVGAPLPPMPR